MVSALLSKAWGDHDVRSEDAGSIAMRSGGGPRHVRSRGQRQHYPFRGAGRICPHRGAGAGADDLTRIGGIGSKIADRLYAAGILTYADLASRSADELSKLLSDVSGLSAGRLDNWRD